MHNSLTFPGGVPISMPAGSQSTISMPPALMKELDFSSCPWTPSTRQRSSTFSASPSHTCDLSTCPGLDSSARSAPPSPVIFSAIESGRVAADHPAGGLQLGPSSLDFSCFCTFLLKS